MGTRAWLAILVMGLGSIVVLGILTKVAVESNPDLQAMIRFKAAFAQDWVAEGVEEVQLRKTPQRRCHLLVVTMPESTASSGAALDSRVAEYFVSRFDGKPLPMLEIDYQAPVFLGCTGQESFRKAQVNLGPVRVRVADQEASRKLTSRLQAAGAARFQGYERGERELRVDLQAPEGFDGNAGDLCLELEPDVRAVFGSTIYSSLRLKLLAAPVAPAPVDPASSGPPPGPLAEVRFDRLGREIDAQGKLTGRGAGPAQH